MTRFVVSAADAEASLAVVDCLARMCLEARRAGFELELCDVGDELRKLIELAGLSDALLGGGVRSQP
jgi:ABC-type transporter Mla MlaB component